nr:tyrosine-type recombinase/integrase [Alphaproteobacteria bacterium]
DRSGKVSETLHAAMVGHIIAKMAKRAEIDAELTGHSLRVGVAQDLTAAGFELSGIMQAGRWKSPEMPARYSARLSAKRGAVAG